MAGVTTRRSWPILTLLLLSSCAPAGSAATATAAGVVAPQARPGCVDVAAARAIWTRVDASLNAVVLDPAHHGLTRVATGGALAQLRTYIQETLVAHGVTEREVDALDSLSVSGSACTGQQLQVTVATRATRDDYLKSNGSLDHTDAMVGVEVHLMETFTRASGVWKESEVQNLDTATPSPGPSGPIL